mgnify:CR=1 FL=1
MKTKAVMIRSHGGPEVLELVEVDVKDPGPDEVRIRQHAIGLNFIDIYYRTGLYSTALPHGLGFEGAGHRGIPRAPRRRVRGLRRRARRRSALRRRWCSYSPRCRRP